MPLEVKDNGWGVTVKIDGVEVPELVEFTMEARVDDVVRARCLVNATAPLDLSFSKHQTTVVLAGCEQDSAAYTALLKRLRVVVKAIVNDAALAMRNEHILNEILRQNIDRYRAGDTSES